MGFPSISSVLSKTGSQISDVPFGESMEFQHKFRNVARDAATAAKQRTADKYGLPNPGANGSFFKQRMTGHNERIQKESKYIQSLQNHFDQSPVRDLVNKIFRESPHPLSASERVLLNVITELKSLSISENGARIWGQLNFGIPDSDGALRKIVREHYNDADPASSTQQAIRSQLNSWGATNDYLSSLTERDLDNASKYLYLVYAVSPFRKEEYAGKSNIFKIIAWSNHVD